MAKRSDIIRAKALSLVGSPYVWGGTGDRCTVPHRQQRIRQYPDRADGIITSCPALQSGRSDCVPGCRHIGRRMIDCAQLVRLSYQAAGISLPSGASSQWRRGKWIKQGPIADMPMDTVCAVYREKRGSNPMGHTGVYLGDGTVVDARGSRYGTLHRPLTSYPWTHYAVMPGMDDLIEALLPDVPPSTPSLAPGKPPVTMGTPVLRYGHRGADVARLQGLLTAAGYPLEQDGIFGRQTREAVRAYQAAHGLTVDGMVGQQTWTSLTNSTNERST